MAIIVCLCLTDFYCYRTIVCCLSRSSFIVSIQCNGGSTNLYIYIQDNCYIPKNVHSVLIFQPVYFPI